jgi:ABC-type uncharacterized transport system substrate-binding protein
MGVAIGLGEDQRDSYRRAADVAATILRGGKPATLPVDMQMRLQLFLNAASLRGLGIIPPPSLLMRATRVFD